MTWHLGIWLWVTHLEASISYEDSTAQIIVVPGVPWSSGNSCASRRMETMDDYHEHKDDDVCWGVAFKIPGTDVITTRAYLDHREKNGYTVHTVDVYRPNEEEPAVRDALVYIGTTDNDAFVGNAPVDEIAKQIYESYGPSGWNAEYLLNLAKALREIAPESRDDHVFELEHKVTERISKAKLTS
ncbi:unnamed protein product [Umbelopsis vinacea]